MDSNGVPPAQEMETFLPQSGKSQEVEEKKYTLTKDAESGQEYDPFADRNLENPTSPMDTLTHLLKASLGTGILSMPLAFKRTGLILGILFTVLVAVVCTHCAYILIKCAHVLYKKTKRPAMSFPEVAESALQNGPEWGKKWAYSFRIFVIVCLFMTYFGTCSVYTVIIAKNIKQVLEDYNTDLDIRFIITSLLVPLILMVWIKNLKYLAPVSMIANIFMCLGLGITMFFLVGTGTLEFGKISLFKPPGDWPEFFSITIFAMEAIGVVMPLENSMKTPRALLGYCGVLSKGMSGVTLIYMLLGFLGYLRFGENVADVITLNLTPQPGDPRAYGILAQVVKISIAIAVYCTFGLQFFVCIEIMWNAIKEKFTKRPNFADYVMRTIMVTLCVFLAVAVPSIAPLIGVIGAFCFSLLGLIAPAIIELITYSDIGYGSCQFLIWKNILVLLFGFFALIFGTKEAILNIIKS